MKLSLILSLIIICMVFIAYLLFLRKKSSKIKIVVSFVTGIVAITILIFPLLEYKNMYLKCLASFMYAIKCVGMGQDLNILSKIDISTRYGYLHFILLNILFIAVPSLTFSFIISYLENIVNFIKFIIYKNKELYVFPEINDKSLTLANNLKNKKNSVIVFAKVKDKKDLNFNAVRISKKITDIKFKSRKGITFYMVSLDEEKNLNETLELINKYKNRDNVKICVINKTEETPIILDSTDKGKVVVEIINEKERSIYNLLNNKPLYLNAINKTISILIVGCGSIGKEFLKDSIWCSTMPGYKVKVLVIDTNADKIKDNIIVESPELLNNYDITFINEDIESKKAIDAVKKRNDINYILVAMDNDDNNIDVAITLRKLFIREYDREPIINLYIENIYKQEQILRLVNEKGYSYNLNAFGSIKDLYGKDSILDSELEKLAIQVHLAYDPRDKELQRYNLREYNKRSSRASALHIKYKLYAILGVKFSNNMKENLETFRKMYSKEIEEILTKNEHDRWNAYMRSTGYVGVSTKEVAKYYEKNKHYIHYLARMHPALVDYDKLDDISKEISKITNEDINLKDNDRKIIKYIYKSLKY